jgi:RHS repeat-associated protein
MRNYTEQYTYDPVGNILKIAHQANGGNWTRDYDYNEPSLIEAGLLNNRLSQTTVGSASPEIYAHDAHGNITSMPHLSQMVWDFEDQLQMVDLGGGGKAHYVYDAGGERVRKVIETQSGARQKERIYLGGFEVYREYGVGGTAVNLERETLYIMDDKQRVALVETRTQGNDSSPTQLIRYQIGNHLGSASMELDVQSQIVSYEEYYPYGSTSYQAMSKTIKAAAKRYRYTGKERDEETGFTYHGVRHYVPWLGRWSSCDTAGLIDGLNLYEYALDRPINFLDRSGTQAELGFYHEGNASRKVLDKKWGSITPNKQIATHQLNAIQEALKDVGAAQAQALGLKGAERERFVMAESKAISVVEMKGRFLLYVDLNAAMEGRGGRYVSWVLERLYHLTQSSWSVGVLTGPDVTGSRVNIGATQGVRESLSVPTVSLVNTKRADYTKTPVRLLGETIIHELVIHAWRDAFFGLAGKVDDWDYFNTSGHNHPIHSLLTSTKEHNWPDIEADVLTWYSRQNKSASRIEESLRTSYKYPKASIKHRAEIMKYVKRAGGPMGRTLYWGYWRNIQTKQSKK